MAAKTTITGKGAIFLVWLTVAAFSSAAVAGTYSGGTGTAEDPYLISTAEDMNAIGANEGDWDKHFLLTADIDLSAYTGTQFNIIGHNAITVFTGVFDGNGHTISNFTYEGSGANALGLFRCVSDPNAMIKNLCLVDPNIDVEGWNYVGLLVGNLSYGTISDCSVTGGSVSVRNYSFGRVGGLVGSNQNGTISNCYAAVTVRGSDSPTGGLAGWNRYGTISNCYATGSVTGDYCTAGLVGRNEGTIENSHFTGEVRGNDSVGGLVGDQGSYGTIWHCYSTATVTGDGYCAGGLVGENSSGTIGFCRSAACVEGNIIVGGLSGQNTGLIERCYCTGQTTGNEAIGGLVGQNSSTIEKCYSTVSVHGGQKAGGLVGLQGTEGTLEDCYSAGAVSGSTNVGGLVGSGAGAVNCFWDVNSSGLDISAGGAGAVGKTTAQMMTAGTFLDAGWDFVEETANGLWDFWTIDQEPNYPSLRLPFSGGAGTEQDPYLIANAADLLSLGINRWNWDDHFLMVNDVNLAALAPAEFKIIGEYYDGDEGPVREPFTGTFDGNGHTISNFVWDAWYLHDEELKWYFCAGLFGWVEGEKAEIKNLTLTSPVVRSRWYSSGTGCLVGQLQGGTIRDCTVRDANACRADYTGGLLGQNIGGKVKRCCSLGLIRLSEEGAQVLGGLVGYNERGVVEDCYVEGEVYVSSDTRCIGGLVGKNYAGTVSNCHAAVCLQWSGPSSYIPIGGLVGINEGYGSGEIGYIVNCYSAGSVLHASSPGGGLVGRNGIITDERDNAIIENCYSSATVTTTVTAGGLVGDIHRGTVRNCYATGAVSGGNFAGGLAGANRGLVENCYATGSTQGNSWVGGLVGAGTGITRNCYATGSVKGTETVGGLLGGSGQAENCYATGKVEGTRNVGGLVGGNGKSIDNCYSTGLVVGDVDVGGLVGAASATATVSDSFWDVLTSGQPSSAGGQAKITPQMQMAGTFINAGWDFIDETVNGSEDIWRLCQDGTDYPKLAWQFIMLGDFVCPDGVERNDLDVFTRQWLMEKLSADVAAGGGDGIVDFLDWAVFANTWQNTTDITLILEFAQQWLQLGAYCADIAPAGGDDKVDMLDFAILARNWLAGVGQ